MFNKKMACKNEVTLLGYKEEIITDKHMDGINFMTNKIGGKPDIPSNVKLNIPLCPLCQFPRPLVVQIYAPLESVPRHRTLYLFACINPNCWNQNESWACLRVETDEKVGDTCNPHLNQIRDCKGWCEDANDWGEAYPSISVDSGYLIGSFDDETCRLEDSLLSEFSNFSFDDRNCNSGIGGMLDENEASRSCTPAATTEIEYVENELVMVDAPILLQSDVPSLLQDTLQLPLELLQNMQSGILPEFVSYFVSVWDECLCWTSSVDNRVRELMEKYQRENGKITTTCTIQANPVNSENTTTEMYEKSEPAHGDKMFHTFLARIKQNPGHMLRYNRGGLPLLMRPLQDIPRTCQNCQGDMVFEFQLLPTLIPELRLVEDNQEGIRLEYGTVLIFTCRKSCWSRSSFVRQEAVIVQAEV